MPPPSQPTPKATYFIAIGSNVAQQGYASPLATAKAAAQYLTQHKLADAISHWYRSPPDPPMPDQDHFYNAVASLKSHLTPPALLTKLQGVETKFGRNRQYKNEPRTLDLDIVAMDEKTCPYPTIPHPRMHIRPFVILPMSELAPHWRHPVLGKPITELIAPHPTVQKLT